MTEKTTPLSRRNVLKGSLATAALVPFAGAVASCASSGNGGGGGGTSPTSTTAPTTSPAPTSTGGGGGGGGAADNPFGLKDNSTVDAVIFNGGYGYDYVTFAADQAKKKFSSVTFKVTPSTTISQQLQPRFVGGNPPDLIDNSGRNQIAFSAILDKLDTLDDVFAANNYEGTKIADTVYPHVKDPGTFDGRFVAVNYAMTVYAVWYSKTLYDANGWTVPKTWDEALALGAKAKKAGKYLWVWGKEASTYYQTLAIDSASKEGGNQVWVDLSNLTPTCWSNPSIQGVFKALETCVKSGYFVPGGAGTQFTAAQAKWSNDEQAILYPSGGWIENEMKKATKANFKMTGAPEMTLTGSSKMPYAALRSAAGEPYIVPSQGKNTAGGKEILRAMLSKEAASNFSKTRFAPTIVKGIVPADGYGSTALVSQTTMLDAAGSNVFDYPIFGLYGMNDDQVGVWNTFLSGGMDTAGLTKALQQITDKVRNDPSVKKIPVKA